MNRRVISFCLYGNTRKYTHGLLEAIVSYKMLFIGWEIWVYISTKTVPKNIIDIIENFGCNIILKEEIGTRYEDTGIGISENNEPMFWRFSPIYDDTVDFCISRDADSRASSREKNFVDEFVTSNKALHSILDQRCHHGLMGGMCGFNVKQLQKYSVPNVNDFIQKMVATENRTKRGQDQTWLRECFKVPITNKDVYLHITQDIITINNNNGIKLENLIFLHNVLLVDCGYTITDSCSNFIGRQINVDATEQDKKVRNSVYLPIIF